MAQLVKESACNAGDLGSIPGLGRSPGEGNGNPLQYSGLVNSMNCIVHGVAKSPTRLSKTFTFIHSNTRLSDFHFHNSNYFPKSRVWKKQGESDFAGENLTNTTLPGAQGQCQGEADNLGFNTSLVRRKRQDPDRAILYTMPDQHYSKLSRSWKISSV